MGRSKGPPARSVTFRLRKPLYDVLDAVARAQGMEVSSLLNQMVVRYLAGYGVGRLDTDVISPFHHDSLALFHEELADCHRSIAGLKAIAKAEGGAS